MTANIIPFFKGPDDRVIELSKFKHGHFLSLVQQELGTFFERLKTAYNFTFSFGEPYNSFGDDEENMDLCTVCTLRLNGHDDPLYIDIEENVRKYAFHVIALPNVSIRTNICSKDGTIKKVFNTYRVQDISNMDKWIKVGKSVTDVDFCSCVTEIMVCHAQYALRQKDARQKPQ